MDDKKYSTKYLETIIDREISNNVLQNNEEKLKINQEIVHNNIEYTDEENYVHNEVTPWPKKYSEEVMQGVLGVIINEIMPYSEADEAAVMMSFLTAFGNIIGNKCYFKAGEDKHHLNIFTVLVGESSNGRKGMSWGIVKRLMKEIENDWCENNITNGLTSGEGLIFRVRNQIIETDPVKKNGIITEYQDLIKDKGIADKRLLIVESEFAATLRVMSRQGNVLSSVIRSAWDGDVLQTLSKNTPIKATGAHISIIGHITRRELKKCLNITETTNGFANRFIWVCSRRSKYLPDGEPIPEKSLKFLHEKVSAALDFTKNVEEIKRNEEANGYWREIYPSICGEKNGVSGIILGRAAPQIMRIACICALLDLSKLVKKQHLKTALGIWKQCEESVCYIFGEEQENGLSSKILEALKSAPMSQSDIYTKVFKNNISSKNIGYALQELSSKGKVDCYYENPNGRKKKIWSISNGSAY